MGADSADTAGRHGTGGFHLRSVPTRSKLVDNDAIGRAFDRLRPQDRLILVGLVPLVVAGVVVAARRWPS